MVRAFVRHGVSDVSAWKKAYDDFASKQREGGVKGEAAYKDLDNPKMVTAYHDFDSLEDAKAFFSSSELAEAMKGAGVTSAPEIWFTEEI